MEAQMELVKPQQERKESFWQEWGVLTTAFLSSSPESNFNLLMKEKHYE